MTISAAAEAIVSSGGGVGRGEIDGIKKRGSTRGAERRGAEVRVEVEMLWIGGCGVGDGNKGVGGNS